jgi:hypothetical protein
LLVAVDAGLVQPAAAALAAFGVFTTELALDCFETDDNVFVPD